MRPQGIDALIVRASAPGGERVGLINGALAHLGIADATGAILRRDQSNGKVRWELVGSGALVAPDAVLTAAHCVKSCPTTADCRFFLPGVGYLPVAKGWATELPADSFCALLPGGGEAPTPDLAFLALEKPVHTVEPIPLPPRAGWQLSADTRARVSGFGTNNRLYTGLRQYADVPVQGSDHDPHLHLARAEVRLAWKDSGGPLVRLGTQDLIGICVESPSKAIRLSGTTLAWIYGCLEKLRNETDALDPGRLRGELECLLCPEITLQRRKPVPFRIDRLDREERFTVTFNAVVGTNSPVEIAIAPGGSEPELLNEESGGYQDAKSLTGPEGDFFVWLEASRATRVQLFYSRMGKSA